LCGSAPNAEGRNKTGRVADIKLITTRRRNIADCDAVYGG